MAKKWDILFIKDAKSTFDLSTKAFETFFNRVDFVEGREAALKAVDEKHFDIIIGDLTVEPEEVGLLKQIKDKELKHAIFAMVDPKDTKKLYGIADLGINAFELTEEQFDAALEALSEFDPYAQEK